MAPPEPPDQIAAIVARIALCDSVHRRLAARNDSALEPLMNDVRRLRASLQATLTSMDGYHGPSAEPA